MTTDGKLLLACQRADGKRFRFAAVVSRPMTSFVGQKSLPSADDKLFGQQKFAIGRWQAFWAKMFAIEPMASFLVVSGRQLSEKHRFWLCFSSFSATWPRRVSSKSLRGPGSISKTTGVA